VSVGPYACVAPACICDPEIPAAFKKVANPAVRDTYYAFIDKKLDWKAAASNCKSLHDKAHLVVIASEEEQQAVVDFIGSQRTSWLTCRIVVIFCGNGHMLGWRLRSKSPIKCTKTQTPLQGGDHLCCWTGGYFGHTAWLYGFISTSTFPYFISTFPSFSAWRIYKLVQNVSPCRIISTNCSKACHYS